MRSMTGYGQSSGTDSRYRVSVSLKSVNSRYLDLAIRLKDEQRVFEPRLRQLLEEQLQRGRVDVSIEVRPLSPAPAEVEIQTEVVRALHRASHELVEKGLVSSELNVGDLLKIPEVITVRVQSAGSEEELWPLLEEQLRTALDQLVLSRQAEGRQLLTVLRDRSRDLASLVSEIMQRADSVRSNIESRLHRRLDSLLGELPVDPARLAQEVAILVDKSDVTEELDRLTGHVEQFESILESEGSVGRRLDFLTQELLRELNTLGSKARDTGLTQQILEGKLLCEQLREQIQNVE